MFPVSLTFEEFSDFIPEAAATYGAFRPEEHLLALQHHGGSRDDLPMAEALPSPVTLHQNLANASGVAFSRAGALDSIHALMRSAEPQQGDGASL
jgi:hypothetical protein